MGKVTPMTPIACESAVKQTPSVFEPCSYIEGPFHERSPSFDESKLSLLNSDEQTKFNALDSLPSEEDLTKGPIEIDIDLPETLSESVDESENDSHRNHLVNSYQALQYMKSVPMPTDEEAHVRRVELPPSDKKLLIFDMDETLIHCVDDIEDEAPQVVINIELEGEIVPAGIHIRPFVK